MRFAMIGVGQAGGKILDEFLAYDAETAGTSVRAAVAINTARTDLEGLEYVPRENRVLIGQARVKGHGVGGDNQLGAEVTNEDLTDVQGAIDHVPVAEIDAFLVIAALGGGTGSGGAPIVADRLRELYAEPVYGLGVLPSREEGGIYTLNAASSFRSFVRRVDNLMLFDNDAWRKTGTSLGESYGDINRELVTRFGVLFRAGELEGDAVAESVVDASEIINTLAAGGVSTVGYATTSVPANRGLLARFRRDGADGEFDAVSAIGGTVRQAIRGRLTLPAEVEGAGRALVVVAGPPKHLSRKGIERSRRWLEAETGSMEVRGGDYPIPGAEKLAAAVLVSGLSEVPRLDELQRHGADTQERIRSRRAEQSETVDELLEPGEDIDSVL